MRVLITGGAGFIGSHTADRLLELGYQVAGRYLSKNRAAYWDGCNQLGEPVSSGIYFYTFIAESERSKWLPQTRKMVILK